MAGPTRPASGTGVTVIPSKMRANVTAILVSLQDIAYDDLHLEAMLDTRGLHRRVSDIQEILDASALDIGKSFSDVISLNGVLTISAVKGLVDLVPIIDQFSRQIGFIRQFNENMTFMDSGSLTCQNYTDPFYFAEGYVGESQIF